MQNKKAFTLIELLIVIAIIGILATLVIAQLGSARTKAANTSAKSDVTEAGKAIEVFRDDAIASERVVSSVLSLGPDTLDGDADNNSDSNQTLDDIFTGTFNYSDTTPSYGLALTKTPSSLYTYTYRAPATDARSMVSIDDVASCYLMYTNAVKQDITFYYIKNGVAEESTDAAPPEC